MKIYNKSLISKLLRIDNILEDTERKDKQNTQERISPSQRMVRRTYVGAKLFPWFCWEWMGCRE